MTLISSCNAYKFSVFSPFVTFSHLPFVLLAHSSFSPIVELNSKIQIANLTEYVIVALCVVPV